MSHNLQPSTMPQTTRYNDNDERQYASKIKLTDNQAEAPKAGTRLHQGQQEKAAGVAQSPDAINDTVTHAADADNNAPRQNCAPASGRAHRLEPGSERKRGRPLRHARTDGRRGQLTRALHPGCHVLRSLRRDKYLSHDFQRLLHIVRHDDSKSCLARQSNDGSELPMTVSEMGSRP